MECKYHRGKDIPKLAPHIYICDINQCSVMYNDGAVEVDKDGNPTKSANIQDTDKFGNIIRKV